MTRFRCQSALSFVVTYSVVDSDCRCNLPSLFKCLVFILKQNRSIQQLEKDLENYKLKKESADVSKIMI